MSEGTAAAEADRPSSGWRLLLPHLLWILAFVLLLDLYALWFVRSEHTLYHADQVAYWSYSRQLARVLVDDPVSAVRAVAHSVAYNDVNLLPAAPVAAAMALIGDSRLAYLISVISLYGFATVVVLAFALRRVCGVLKPWVAPLAVGLLSTLWRPVFIGYLGVGGVALGLAVLAMILPTPKTRREPREMILAGFLLALLALFRRWWAIWVMGFAGALLVDVLWTVLVLRPRDSRSIRRSLQGPVVLGFCAVVTLMVLAAPITLQRIGTDYADRFTAYDLGGAGARLSALLGQFGIVGLVLLAGCTFLLVRVPATRRLAVFLSVHLVLTYTIMVSIQDHSPQHWYLYYPQAVLLVGVAIQQLASVDLRRHNRITVGVLVVIAAIVTAAVYLPTAAAPSDAVGPLLPSDRLRPQVRHDLAEVDRLLSFLDQKLEQTPGRVYVLASSRLLSDQVLAFSNLSLGADHQSPRAILGAAHVDRRDGFPRSLLTADIVLVAEPVQVHLREEDQQVIAVPARSFLRGTDVALAFHELPDAFMLDSGVRVKVFERYREIDRGEVEALSARLRSAYPDRPDIYRP